MKKRLLSSFMVLVMVLSMVPTTAFATGEIVVDDTSDLDGLYNYEGTDTAVLGTMSLVEQVEAYAATPSTVDTEGTASAVIGQEGNPFKIGNATVLAELATLVNGEKTYGSYSYADASYEMVANIDLSGMEWVAIGGDGGTFTGDFDGKGYTISNLTINVTDTEAIYTGYYGLFGDVDGATISNVTVDGDINVVYGNSVFAGGIVGSAGVSTSGLLVTVSDCVSYVNINVSASQDGAGVGGIVGYAWSDITIENCYGAGDLSATTTSDASPCAGGIVGGIFSWASTATVSNCFSTASVAATMTCNDTNLSPSAGGIAGDVGGSVTFTNCVALNESVSATVSAEVGVSVGYIVDSSSPTPTKCYAWDGMTLTTNGSDATAKDDGKVTKLTYSGDAWTNTGLSSWSDIFGTDMPTNWSTSMSELPNGDDLPSYIADGTSGETEDPVTPDDDLWTTYIGGITDLTETNTDGAYIITTAEQLAFVAQEVNAKNETYNSASYVLGNSIDLSAHEWVAIGMSGKNFTGTFDGDGHTISGLYINNTDSSSGKYQGLFGYVNGGKVENVHVSGSVTGYQLVGGVVGYNIGGTVSGCSFSGSVTSSYGDVGGVVGYNTGTVQYCYNTSVVTNNGAGYYAGGVVGTNYGGSATVSNCYNTGSVSSSYQQVGGVVGYSDSKATVSNCYNTGNVSGTEKVGGVVGQNGTASVSNCVSLANTITGTINVGRVVGYNSGTISGLYAWSGMTCTGTDGTDLYYSSSAGFYTLDDKDAVVKFDWETMGYTTANGWTVPTGDDALYQLPSLTDVSQETPQNPLANLTFITITFDNDTDSTVTIENGGKLTADDIPTTAPTGKMWNVDYTMAYYADATIIPVTIVATIGTTNYASLAAALTAAGENKTTITLQADTSESVTIPSNVTIDLNNCTVTGTQTLSAGATVSDGTNTVSVASGNASFNGTTVTGDSLTIGSVTVTLDSGSTGDYDLSWTSGNAYITIPSGATATVGDITVTGAATVSNSTITTKSVTLDSFTITCTSDMTVSTAGVVTTVANTVYTINSTAVTATAAGTISLSGDDLSVGRATVGSYTYTGLVIESDGNMTASSVTYNSVTYSNSTTSIIMDSEGKLTFPSGTTVGEAYTLNVEATLASTSGAEITIDASELTAQTTLVTAGTATLSLDDFTITEPSTGFTVMLSGDNIVLMPSLTEGGITYLPFDGTVTDGGSYYLTGEYTGDLTIAEGTTVNLYLNGKTFTGTITNYGTLNIYDIEANTGKVTGAVTNNGTLSIYGGTYESAVTNNGTLNLSGAPTFNSGVTLADGKTITVTGELTGTIAIDADALKAGDIVVNDGTYTELTDFTCDDFNLALDSTGNIILVTKATGEYADYEPFPADGTTTAGDYYLYDEVTSLTIGSGVTVYTNGQDIISVTMNGGTLNASGSSIDSVVVNADSTIENLTGTDLTIGSNVELTADTVSVAGTLVNDGTVTGTIDLDGATVTTGTTTVTVTGEATYTGTDNKVSVTGTNNSLTYGNTTITEGSVSVGSAGVSSKSATVNGYEIEGTPNGFTINNNGTVTLSAGISYTVEDVTILVPSSGDGMTLTLGTEAITITDDTVVHGFAVTGGKITSSGVTATKAVYTSGTDTVTFASVGDNVLNVADTGITSGAAFTATYGTTAITLDKDATVGTDGAVTASEIKIGDVTYTATGIKIATDGTITYPSGTVITDGYYTITLGAQMLSTESYPANTTVVYNSGDTITLTNGGTIDTSTDTITASKVTVGENTTIYTVSGTLTVNASTGTTTVADNVTATVTVGTIELTVYGSSDTTISAAGVVTGAEYIKTSNTKVSAGTNNTISSDADDNIIANAGDTIAMYLNTETITTVTVAAGPVEVTGKTNSVITMDSDDKLTYDTDTTITATGDVTLSNSSTGVVTLPSGATVTTTGGVEIKLASTGTVTTGGTVEANSVTVGESTTITADGTGTVTTTAAGVTTATSATVNDYVIVGTSSAEFTVSSAGIVTLTANTEYTIAGVPFTPDAEMTLDTTDATGITITDGTVVHGYALTDGKITSTGVTADTATIGTAEFTGDLSVDENGLSTTDEFSVSYDGGNTSIMLDAGATADDEGVVTASKITIGTVTYEGSTISITIDGTITYPSGTVIVDGNTTITLGGEMKSTDANYPAGTKVVNGDNTITLVVAGTIEDSEVKSTSVTVNSTAIVSGDTTTVTVKISTGETTVTAGTVTTNSVAMTIANGTVETDGDVTGATSITVGDTTVTGTAVSATAAGVITATEGDEITQNEVTVTVTTGSTDVTVEDDKIVMTNDDSLTYGSTTITATGNVTMSDDKVNLPADATVTTGGVEITLKSAGSVDDDGTVSANSVTVDGTTITATTGTVTTTAAGVTTSSSAVTISETDCVDVEIAAGDLTSVSATGTITVSEVTIGGTVLAGSGTKITMGESAIVTLPANGTITAGEKTYTVTAETTVTVSSTGVVTLPNGATLNKDGLTIKTNTATDSTINTDGTMTLTASSTVGAVTVATGTATYDDGTVKVEEPNSLTYAGQTITLGTATVGSDKIELTAGTVITNDDRTITLNAAGSISDAGVVTTTNATVDGCVISGNEFAINNDGTVTLTAGVAYTVDGVTFTPTTSTNLDTSSTSGITIAEDAVVHGYTLTGGKITADGVTADTATINSVTFTGSLLVTDAGVKSTDGTFTATYGTGETATTITLSAGATVDTAGVVTANSITMGADPDTVTYTAPTTTPDSTISIAIDGTITYPDGTVITYADSTKITLGDEMKSTDTKYPAETTVEYGTNTITLVAAGTIEDGEVKSTSVTVNNTAIVSTTDVTVTISSGETSITAGTVTTNNVEMTITGGTVETNGDVTGTTSIKVGATTVTGTTVSATAAGVITATVGDKITQNSVEVTVATGSGDVTITGDKIVMDDGDSLTYGSTTITAIGNVTMSESKVNLPADATVTTGTNPTITLKSTGTVDASGNVVANSVTVGDLTITAETDGTVTTTAAGVTTSNYAVTVSQGEYPDVKVAAGDLTDVTDGTITVKKATIGGTVLAGSGTTITMGESAIVTLPANGTITVNDETYTVSAETTVTVASDGVVTLTNGATLTKDGLTITAVANSTINADGTMTLTASSTVGAVTVATGTATYDDGTVKVTGTSSLTYAGQTITIGTATINSDSVSLTEDTVITNSTTTVTLNAAGSVDSDGVVTATNATVNNYTVTGTTDFTVATDGTITLTATGITVTVDSGTLDLSDFTLTDALSNTYYLAKNSDGDIIFGAFDSLITSDWTAFPSNGDLEDGKNYYMVENYTGDVTLPESGTVKLALNGYTLTDSDGITLATGVTLTLVDTEGTIDGDVTVEGGTFTMTNGTVTGKVTVNSGTFNLAGNASITGNVVLASGQSITVSGDLTNAFTIDASALSAGATVVTGTDLSLSDFTITGTTFALTANADSSEIYLVTIPTNLPTEGTWEPLPDATSSNQVELITGNYYLTAETDLSNYTFAEGADVVIYLNGYTATDSLSVDTTESLIIYGAGTVSAALTVDGGNLTLDGCTVTGDITLNGGTLDIDNATVGDVTVTGTSIVEDLTIANGKILTINNGDTLTVTGTLTNNGTVTNNGTLTTDGTGEIANAATITNNSTLSGTIANTGTVTNGEGATYNTSTVTNTGGGLFICTALPSGTTNSTIFSSYSETAWFDYADGDATFTGNADWTVCATTNGTFADSISYTTEGTALVESVYVQYDGFIYPTTVKYNLDKTKPVATIDTATNTSWQTSDVTIDVTVSDTNLTSWEYSLDAGTTWTEAADKTDTSFTISTDGDYTDKVKIRATDVAGNVTTTDVITVKLDKVQSTVSVTAKVGDDDYTSGNWSDTNVVFTLTGTDATSGVAKYEYSTNDGTSWTEIAIDNEAYTLTVSADTNSTIYIFRTTDNAGKVSDSTDAITVKLDKTDPTITSVTASTVDGESGWHTDDVTVTVVLSDTNLKEWYYSTDNGANWSSAQDTATTTFTISTDDDYTDKVVVKAVDEAGNTTTSTAITVKLDTTDPTITSVTASTIDGENGWYIADVTVTVALSDTNFKEWYYSTDNGSTWSSAQDTAVTAFTITTDGDYTDKVVVKAVDEAGNTTTSDAITVKLDKTAPVLTLHTYSDTNWYGASHLIQSLAETNVDAVVVTGDSLDAEGVTLTYSETSGYTYATTETTAGTYTYTITVTDLAGNTDSETVTFHFDPVIDEATDYLANSYTSTTAITANNWYNSLTALEQYHLSLCTYTADMVSAMQTKLADITEDMADAVTDAIATADTIDEINAAKAAYDALTDEAKALVSDEEVAALDALVANAAYASAVQTLLDAAMESGATYTSKLAAITAYDSYMATYGATLDLISSGYDSKYSTISNEIADVTALITAVKAVSAPYNAADRTAIEAIKAAYTALDSTEQTIFDGTTYKTTYDTLIAALDAVVAVETAIANLTSSSSEAEIKAAKTAYDTLSSDDKAMVSTASSSALTTAYNAMVAAQDAAAQAVTTFETAVSAAYVSPTSAKIAALTTTYNAFTDAQKADVSTGTMSMYADLTETKATIDIFDAIEETTLTSDSMGDVNTALDSYNALNTAQQSLVDTATSDKTTTLTQAMDTYGTAAAAIAALASIGTDYSDADIELIEAAKIAYEKLTTAGRLLISETQKTTLNTAYDGLITYLEYVNAVTTESSGITVEVAGLSDKVDTQADASVDKVIVSVEATDSTPVITPTATEDSKTQLLSVDVKLLAQYYNGETEIGSAYVQPAENETILLKMELPTGYQMDTMELWHVKDDGTSSLINECTIITEDGKNYAVFETDSLSHFVFFAEKTVNTSSGSSSYSSSVATAENGDVSVSATKSKLNATVTITATPDDGYQVGTVTVTYSSGREVTVTDNGDGTYSYKQPGASVTVTVTFVEIGSETESEDSFFVDVDEDDWFYDAVKWAVENSVTSGTTTTTFSPYDITTRGQTVTFLWRSMEMPEAEGTTSFDDVVVDSYYELAVLWAAENDITKGTSDTTFSPDMDCTRAQIITFLWRMMGEPVVDSINLFTDVDADSYYYDAVLWAVGAGITTGTTDTTFSPDKDCTRVEIVTFLYRALAE